MINAMRGEFEAQLAGQIHAFDTTLGSIAAIETGCGDRSIVEIINACVFGRRAADQIALLAAALTSRGHDRASAEQLSARTASVEAEDFVLALMRALGFEIADRAAPSAQTGGERPLGGTPAGDAGGNSRSAP